ncbi:hypothetical protein DITRI_Ditri03aG0153900 [Diplodiscus trichospermus]
MDLTMEGISIADPDGNLKWSTPQLEATVHALLLTEMGNLVLIDQFNGSLWESFHYPTDTIVIAQRLPLRANLSSAVSGSNLSTSDYRFMVSASDAILQWHGQAYLKLSTDTLAYINSDYVVEYMTVNKTGLYLFGHNGSVIVIQVNLLPTKYQLSNCQVGCFWSVYRNSISNAPTCSCPSGFHLASQNIDGCFPNNHSYSLPASCDSTNNVSESNSSAISCLRLSSGMDYCSLVFSQPLQYAVKFSGYVKVLVGPTLTASSGDNSFSNQSNEFPVAALVLLPFTGFFLLAALVFVWWKSWIINKAGVLKLGHLNSLSSGHLDAFYIPGLPQKFDYEELELATNNFKTQIGSGGFGAIYKAALPDKTVVAIKKITNPGIQGKKNSVQKCGYWKYSPCQFGQIERILCPRETTLFGVRAYEQGLTGPNSLRQWACPRMQRSLILGCQKLLSPEQSSLFTTMRGTRGCLAPEWLTNSASSEKTDVYSFGMVLLELERLAYFPLFALEMHEQGRSSGLADPRLEGHITNKEVETLVRVALCSRGAGTEAQFTEASMIKEENGQSNFMLFQQANASHSSTTGKLVKNTFLKNERTFSRKILEMVLALALERTISKQGILSSYVCKIYWGHGINGIESASNFYFGKHPSLLSLAESAMLAGLIPAPELRSPLRDQRSGKTFQARVLKRMVQVGFLDIEMALLTLREPLCLHLNRPEHADGLSYLLSFSGLGLGEKNKLAQVGKESTFKGTWDWERESKIWEVCEEMERWAMKVEHRT